jgi:alcohol dehydrogenase (cytochrome c)
MANNKPLRLDRNASDEPAPDLKAPTSAPEAHVVQDRPPGGRRRGWWAWIAFAGIVVVAATVVIVPAIRWRAQALVLDMTGRIPDIEPAELWPMLLPGSGQPQIARIIHTHNPYPVIHIPEGKGVDATAGAALFRQQCADCHSPDGSGGPGAPALRGRDFKHGDTDWAIYRTIRNGVPGTNMPPHPLQPLQLWDLVAYLRTLGPGGGDAEQAALLSKAAHVRLSYDELAGVHESGADWLTFSGAYNSNRHSALTQINSQNVGQLALRWMYQFEGVPDKNESSPLVRDGVLYVTAPMGHVMALDAATGRQIWSFHHPFEVIAGGEGPLGQNRGAALLGERLFVGTWDSKLFALSAATGNVLWETTVGQYPGTYISAAPLVYRDLVVVGIGSPPGFGRGFIAAYDVATGKERWRFQTIPGPGEKGHETWAGDSWRKGGAGSWVTGSYDPTSDTLYWGIGNPRPDFEPGKRAGDNLYADSVVALRGLTGQLLWHFQFTPADDHDWDSSQVPLLADRTGAVPGKRLLWANRNGFYYVLDRENGRFHTGVPFVRQNWALGLDSNGRPRRAPMTDVGAQGKATYPGAKGGTNWWPPSYDPTHDLVFVPVLEQGMVFFPSEFTLPSTAGHSFYTAVRALESGTGRLVWEYRHEARTTDPNSSGLLSTAGNLVFGADHGRFFALDEQTGKLLWQVETGGATYSAPVTWSAGGEQFVAVIAGRTLLTFALPEAHNPT